jgi:hypothetical protein
MKILIDNGNPIRLYHHPREVIVHPKTNVVEILNADGSLLESYELIKKEWDGKRMRSLIPLKSLSPCTSSDSYPNVDRIKSITIQ